MFSTTVETHPNDLSAVRSIIPFEALKLDASREHFTFEVDKDNLENIPSFDKNRAMSVAGLDAERNKGLCRRFIQKIVNEGELLLIGDFMSSDVVNHELVDSFGDSELPRGHSIEWMADLVFLYRRAFPDLRVEIQDQISEGDRVVTCLRMQGTQKNALMTIAASGRKIDVAGIRVDRVAGGKIVESWSHFDMLGMLRQLDALPALNDRPQQVAPASRETSSESRLPVAGWNPAAALPQSALVS
jgi:predicted ester cyclase